jgi:hypothetical protein
MLMCLWVEPVGAIQELLRCYMLNFESFMFTYLLLLPIARIAFVGWLYLETRNTIVLIYLVYLVANMFLRSIIEAWIVRFVQKAEMSKSPKWLGKEPEQRSINALSLAQAIEGTIQLIFVMSLMYALLITQVK